VALDAGTRLGPYEVTALVGAGERGDVYRATDTRVNRTVAIKTVASLGATFEAGPPQQGLIFPAVNLAHTGGDYHPYAVSPDGERFLVPQFVPSSSGALGQLGPDVLSGLTVAVDWPSSLKK